MVGGLAKPFFDEVKFEVTATCNQNCSFCINSNTFARKNRAVPDLSTEQCFSIIDNVAASGVKTVRFTGGEPLVRADFEQLVKYAKINGLYVKLNTNGAAFSQESLRTAIKYVDWVLFPLHALNAKGEENLTGNPRAFEKKRAAMRALSNNGIFTAANTLATTQNILDLKKFVELQDSLGLNYWFINLQAPSRNEPFPDANKHLEMLLEKIAEYRKQGRIFRLGGTLPLCCYEPELTERALIGVKQCGGIANIVVGPEGSIRPCCADELILGNALSDNLREVWDQNETIKKFQSFGFANNACKSCALLEKCGGGCRVYSQFATGSYEGMDPRAKPEEFIKTKAQITRAKKLS